MQVPLWLNEFVDFFFFFFLDIVIRYELNYAWYFITITWNAIYSKFVNVYLDVKQKNRLAGQIHWAKHSYPNIVVLHYFSNKLAFDLMHTNDLFI